MKKILIFAGILILIIGIPIANKFTNKDSINQVEIEPVGLQVIKASKLASGQLIHEEEVKLTAEVIGKVTRLLVIEGDKVIKGQLLLTIDDETYTAAVEQQQAAVDQQKITIEKNKMIVANQKKQWERKSQLFNQKLLDKDAYELITHQYQVSKIDLKATFEMLKQLEAHLDQSKDQLSKTRIVSPIDGTITSLDIKVGETAISSSTNIAGSSLMTIANPLSMLAEINVDEADIANVAIGQRAEIISIAYPDTPLKGTVYAISSSAKQALGRQNLSFAVKLKLDVTTDNENRNQIINLRPGMSCRAEIFTQGEQELLAISIRAIQTKEDNEKELLESFVFLSQAGIAKKVVIKTGISDDTFQQVIEGLKEKDSVINGPNKILRRLKDGDLISIVEKENSSQPF